MKCDELRIENACVYGSDAKVYLAEQVDAAIAELKQKLMPCLNGDCILTCEVVEKYGKENAELKQKLDKAIAERDGNQVCIDALKQKLENVQASMYADVVDANMKVRRLKRALYKACANWAVCEMDYWRKCLEHYEDYFNVRTDEDLTEEKCERMIDNWRKVAHNCRAKEEEYK